MDRDTIETLFQRLEWWSHESNLRTERDVDLRFQREWLGGRTDVPGTTCPAATILWDLTRQVSLRGSVADRDRLRRMLDQALSQPQSGLLRNLLVTLDPGSFRTRPLREDSPVELELRRTRRTQTAAHVHAVIRVALLALRCLSQSAMEPAEILDVVLQLQRALDPLAVVPVLDPSSIVCSGNSHAVLAESLTSLAAVATAPVRAAVVQVWQAVEWLLGADPAPYQSLLVPLVTADCSEGRLVLLEIGPIASVDTREDWSDGLLVSDLAFQGLTMFDVTWHKALAMAVRGAVAVTATRANARTATYSYRLRFPQVSPGLPRPHRVTGPSASLAAALLIRADRERRTLATNWCVSGAVEFRDGGLEMSDVCASLPKLAAFQRQFAATTTAAKLVIGPARFDDEATLAALNELQATPSVIRVTSFDDAFRLVTGLPEIFQWIWRAERHRTARTLGLFLPRHLDPQFVATPGSKGNTAARQSRLLESLHLPQRAARPLRHAGNSPSEAMPLDRLMSRFLENPHQGGTLRILGEPGMGKTWAGLRWHGMLLGRFWRHLTDGKAAASGQRVWFPVWIPARELGRYLRRSETIVDALTQFVGESITALGARARTRRALHEFLQEMFESHRVLLTVDAWDERPRTARLTQRLEAGLCAWQESNRLIVTSRRDGDLQRDPLSFLGRDEDSWILETERSRDIVERFVQCWFGEVGTLVATRLREQFAAEPLLDMFAVPQFGAILCWLIEEQALPASDIARARVLQSAIQQLLLKESVRADHLGQTRYAASLRTGRMLQLLQHVCYRTFDGERWVVTARALARELQEECYQGYGADLVADPDQAAERILACGLFTTTGDVIHQSLAEVLIAGHLVEQQLVPSSGSHHWTHRQAARLGMLEPRFLGVWRAVAELQSDSTVLIQFIGQLLQNTPPGPAWSTTRVILLRLLNAGASGATVRPGLGALQDVAAKLSDGILEHVSRSDAPSLELWRGLIHLGRQGYDEPLVRVLRDFEDQLTARTDDPLHDTRRSWSTRNALAAARYAMTRTGTLSLVAFLEGFDDPDAESSPVLDWIPLEEFCTALVTLWQSDKPVSSTLIEKALRSLETSTHPDLSAMMPLAIQWACDGGELELETNEPVSDEDISVYQLRLRYDDLSLLIRLLCRLMEMGGIENPAWTRSLDNLFTEFIEVCLSLTGEWWSRPPGLISDCQCLLQYLQATGRSTRGIEELLETTGNDVHPVAMRSTAALPAPATFAARPILRTVLPDLLRTRAADRPSARVDWRTRPVAPLLCHWLLREHELDVARWVGESAASRAGTRSGAFSESSSAPHAEAPSTSLWPLPEELRFLDEPDLPQFFSGLLRQSPPEPWHRAAVLEAILWLSEHAPDRWRWPFSVSWEEMTGVSVKRLPLTSSLVYRRQLGTLARLSHAPGILRRVRFQSLPGDTLLNAHLQFVMRHALPPGFNPSGVVYS